MRLIEIAKKLEEQGVDVRAEYWGFDDDASDLEVVVQVDSFRRYHIKGVRVEGEAGRWEGETRVPGNRRIVDLAR